MITPYYFDLKEEWPSFGCDSCGDNGSSVIECGGVTIPVYCNISKAITKPNDPCPILYALTLLRHHNDEAKVTFTCVGGSNNRKVVSCNLFKEHDRKGLQREYQLDLDCGHTVMGYRKYSIGSLRWCSYCSQKSKMFSGIGIAEVVPETHILLTTRKIKKLAVDKLFSGYFKEHGIEYLDQIISELRKNEHFLYDIPKSSGNRVIEFLDVWPEIEAIFGPLKYGRNYPLFLGNVFKEDD